MSIHQLQVSFVAEEDRLLFKLSTTDGMQFHSWLTRRFIRLVWPNLIKALEDNAPNTDGSETTKQLVASFQLEKAKKSTDLSQNYGLPQGVTGQFPLGEMPFTVVKSAITPLGNQSIKLTLLPIEGKGFDVVLNHSILLTLMNLIVDAVAKTDWETDLAMPGNATDAAEEKPALLN